MLFDPKRAGNKSCLSPSTTNYYRPRRALQADAGFMPLDPLRLQFFW
jgi:hypothetical protein